MVGAPLATELAAADVTELAIGVDETAREDAATDDGARLLASAIEDVALDAGADPPPLPPPPPQALIASRHRSVKGIRGARVLSELLGLDKVFM